MKKSKYSNRKTILDGITFDSVKEARRYQELKLMEKAGKICDLRLQVPFMLTPTMSEPVERYGKRGQRIKDGLKVIERECKYIADFVYIDTETGEKVVEDTKGVKTEAYKIKRKLMLWKYGIKIKEV